MTDEIRIHRWTPTTIDRAEPGDICVYPPESIDEVIESLPDGAELFGVHRSREWRRVNVPVRRGRRRGTLAMVPDDSWPGVEPEDAARIWIETFGFHRPTPGGAARSLIRELIVDASPRMPMFGANGIGHERIPSLSTDYQPGPIQRQISPTIAGSATVIDLNAAYLAAMTGELMPYGRPYLHAGPGTVPRTLAGLLTQVPDGLCGIVECDVRDAGRWHGCRLPGMERAAYPETYRYRGTWAELRRGLERGRLEQLGPLVGLVFNARIDDSLGKALRPWLEPDPADPDASIKRRLAKLVYTRGWVQHVYPGYRRGIVSSRGMFPDGYRVHGASHRVAEIEAGIDPTIDPRMRRVIQRPDRSAHVIGAIRSALLDLAQDVTEAGGQVGQLLVDAAIVSSEHIPAGLPLGTAPGTWKVEDADYIPGQPAVGLYVASGPGRYQIRTENGSILRDRHAGLKNPLSADEMDRASGALPDFF